MLLDAKAKKLITVENLGKLLHFREVTLDAFHLLDKDNDNKLRKFTLDADLQHHEGDINEEFWKHLESNLHDPMGKDS